MNILVSLWSLGNVLLILWYTFIILLPPVRVSLTKKVILKALARHWTIPSFSCQNCRHQAGTQFSILCQDYLAPKLSRGCVSLWSFHSFPQNSPWTAYWRCLKRCPQPPTLSGSQNSTIEVEPNKALRGDTVNNRRCTRFKIIFCLATAYYKNKMFQGFWKIGTNNTSCHRGEKADE